MHKFINAQGSVLLIQRPREVQDFLNRQPRVLPPAARPRRSLLALLVRLVLVAVALLGLGGLLLIAFLLLGEERPERVRPDLTPEQRAQAFRIPHS